MFRHDDRTRAARIETARIEATIARRQGRRLGLQALALVAIAGAFTLRFAVVHGPSMEPTIPAGGAVLFVRPTFLAAAPRRGDVIAFRGEIDGPTLLVKRVVAIAGDAVRIDRGTLVVDGRRVGEPYVRLRDGRSAPETRVPPNALYVLGDDRPRSVDSRRFGCIGRGSVVGAVFFALWPPGRLGTIRPG